MVGTTVGKYRIVERLGRGGMGTVYKAVDETLDREVAIKVLNPDLADRELMKRFRAEAVTLARLNHPGIATIYELHRQHDDLLMVMEYVRGETLHDLCDRIGPMAPPQAVHICAQVLDALAYAHRAGVVHRDLKPANLMIGDTGAIKVMDFGIARVLGGEHLTHGGYMMGTPAYMSPEQVLGKEIDGRADLYSVGVVFYRLLTGELPFRADTAISMAQKQIADAPTPIGHFRPDLPAWCTEVIERALAKSPEQRFQTAEEFRARLAGAVRAESIGEMETRLTPTPTGLVRAPEIEDASEAVVLTSAGGRTAAVAVAAGASTVAARVAATAVPPTPTATPSPERTTTTVVLGRTHLAAIGGLGVVLLAGIGILAIMALRSNRVPPSTYVSQIAAPPAATATPSPSPDAATAPPPANTAAAPAAPAAQGAGRSNRAGAPGDPTRTVATAGSGPAAIASGSPTAPAGTVPPGADAGRGRGAGRGADATAAKPPVGANPPAGANPPPAVVPMASFDNVRVLTSENGKTRERQGQLQLAGDHLAIVDRDGRSTLASLPYRSVVSAHYSRSKQPKWKDESGKEVESKIDLGRLGFLRSERNWLILLTGGEPVVLRFEDTGLQAALAAIQERTGVKIQR